jgi:hypothetical protein
MATWYCAECGHPNDTAYRVCAICGSTGPDDRPQPAPVEQQPVRRAPRRPALPVALAAAAVLLLAAGGGYLWAGADRTGDDPATASASPPAAPPSTMEQRDLEPPPGTPEPSQVGLVRVADTTGDWRGTTVAALFDAHFSSINNRDYATAASYFDPSGVVDPTDPTEVAAFGEDMSTTTDSDVTLWTVTEGPDGAVLARVTFRSTQQPGYGPPGRSAETCTDWDVTYVLRPTTDGAYRIVRGTDVLSRPC